MRLLYLTGARLYVIAVNIAALWNSKAKKWVAGRREAFKKLSEYSARSSSFVTRTSTYWFHCASLGEFEQGRPLIEGLKSKENCSIIITFFSPSGYEIRRNYDLADLIIYLPNDGKKNAKRFFDLVKPDAVFFVKYEFWADYIFEAQKRNIPLYSVCAVFRKNQVFFKWYGGYMRKVLCAVKTIFVQDENSKKLLETIGISSVVSGDTRYDRVMANAAKAQRFQLIDKFTEGHQVIVCGSIWQDDADVIIKALNGLDNKWKIIVAPHEISDQQIQSFQKLFTAGKVIRHSEISTGNVDAKILIIDNIGMLMHLYGYANLAYVGGAFHGALHNILEPACFGLPVVFGPKHEKFPEAKLFIDNGIGFSISTAEQFESILKKLMGENHRERVLGFMNSKRGATNVILSNI